MIVYVLLMITTFIYGLYLYLMNNSKQSKKIFLFFSFVSMTVILGLRGSSVGEDTGHYLNVFKNAAYVSWSDIFHRIGMRTAYFTDNSGYTDTIESGFLIFCKTIHLFTNNGQVFLFIMAGITCSLFAKFIYDNSEKVFLSTYVFLCESTFMLAFNGARQMLAGAIAIQAYTLLKKKRNKAAFFIIILASLIHNVSLVCLLLFPIMLVKPKDERKSFKYAIIATIVAPFLIFALRHFIILFFPRYSSYFYVNYWQNRIGGITILWIIEIMYILIMYWKRFTKENSFQLSSLVLFYIACELTGLQITMFSRVGWFFRPYLLLYFANVEKIFSSGTRRAINLVIIILLALLYFSYASTPARQYSFFWQYR